MPRSYRQIERIVRGFSNHRRIQMLHVLERYPELSLSSIAAECGIALKNASEHARRLAIAGLIFKRSKGRQVLHVLSPRGRTILSFVRTLE